MEPIKVLLADRSTTIQRIVKLAFEGEPIEVIVASSGQEAIEKLRAERPDVLLVDIRLPDIDGFQICETLRTDPAWKDFVEMPVLLMTGIYDTMEGKREALEQRVQEVGAHGLIVKPFDPQELVDQIKALAGETSRKVPGAREVEPEEEKPSEEVLEAEPTVQLLEEATMILSPEERETLLGEGELAETELTVSGETEETPVEIPADILRASGMEAPREEPPTQPGLPEFAEQAEKLTPEQPEEEAIFPVEELKESEVTWLVEQEAPFELGEVRLPPVTKEVEPPITPPEVEEPSTREEPVMLEEVFEEALPSVEPETSPARPFPEAEPAVSVSPDMVRETLQKMLQDPEFVRMIADRVVQFLSKETLEDIAWQVVPELAEEVIRQRIEEKKQE